MERNKALSFLIASASLVILIAGMKLAASIIVPFLLAIFIVIISMPFVSALHKRGFPSWLAMSIVLVLMLLSVFLIGMLLTVSVQGFSQKIPGYDVKLGIYRDQLITLAGKIGMDADKAQFENIFDPGKIMKFAAGALKSLTSLLSDSLLIMITVIFIFIESSTFTRKIKFISRDKLDYFTKINDKVNNYMMIKTAVSIVTGGLVAGILAIIGVDFALLWGLVAFLLNFIPNIGSIIAAIPPVILALVQLGIPEAIGVAAVFIIINMVMGNAIEPRLMGKGLGLSVLVIFISLVFWGWVLGTIGMFLSVPITIVIKIILESQPETRWIAILLGDGRAEDT